MNFEWDEQKRIVNLKKHCVDFVAAYQLWDSPMVITEDTRVAYGEPRWVGMGLLRTRVMIVVFTKRHANTIRIISFRKANRREVTLYEKIIAS